MTDVRFEAPAKQRVWDFNTELFAGKRPVAEILADHCSASVEFNAGCPMDLLQGASAIAQGFVEPLRRALPDVSRRTLLFFADAAGDSGWVTAVGNYAGTFQAPLFGIAPTGRPVFIRFGEFYRIESGRIAGCHLILDLLDLMRQAGAFPLRASLGEAIVVPGPATQDGIVRASLPRDEGRKSLKLVVDMIDGLMRYDPDTGDFGVMRHADFWHPDFMWYGPAGIGTTRGIDGFIAGHQRPFLTAFPDRKGIGHEAELAEGNYTATFGWPSLGATHAGGGWLGLAPTHRKITMRVMDWWRRDGDLLAENWVLIDIPDLLRQLGMDLFESEG